MAKRQLFGTDGIRGKANVYPMTGEVAFSLGRAVTEHFKKLQVTARQPLIILGKDTRLSCYMLEQAFSAGVCSQGGKVILTGPLPTPGIAFVTKSMRADAGVMISASHNPYYDNGIKIFDADGLKLPDSVEQELENTVLNPKNIPVMTNGDLGNAVRLKEVFGRYLVHCKAAIDERYGMEGMKIVLDCAHGAGYKVTPMMFRELGAKVFTLGVSPNGLNINDECGSMYPALAAKKVQDEKADLGVCLDGDADRCVIINEAGNVVDGDQLIGCFAKLLLDQRVLNKGDTIVGTIMSNLGLENYLVSLGLEFHRTQVGDRYIIEYMSETGAILGGEPSGHVIFRQNATTGDGSLAALKMVECMKFYDKSVSELTAEVDLYPMKLVNVQVGQKPPLEENKAIQECLKAVEERMGKRGRVVLRYSGTEPKIRVMVEGDQAELVDRACQELVEVVTRELT